MASDHDEINYSHILRGVDYYDDIKTFTELKPAQLPFQEEYFCATQDSFEADQLQSYTNFDKEYQDKPTWLQHDTTHLLENQPQSRITNLSKS